MEQFIGSSKHFFRLDGQQSRLRCCIAFMVQAARRAAQYFEFSPEWPVAAGVGGSIESHHGPAKSAGQVQRASISGNY